MKIITVFGSYRPKPGSRDYRLAQETGKRLARAGFVLCNGGFSGTMEASAKGAHEAGGRTVGILFKKPGLSANPYIQRVEKKRTLLGRLERLLKIADGYLVLKGGTGTLLEISLFLEYTHKQFLPPKPMVFLGTYWKKVIETVRKESGPDPRFRFTAPAKRMRRLIRFARTPEEAVRLLKDMV